MKYFKIETTSWPTDPLPWWCRVLKKIIPAANPDIDGLYPMTTCWWVEVDDFGKPVREIGFNDDGDAIVLGPVGRNYGFLVDSPTDWVESEEDSEQVKVQFNKVWQTLWPTFEHLDKE